MCVVDDSSFMTVWDGRPVAQGRAVALWSIGASQANETERVFAVVGAPGADDDDKNGTVRILEGSRTTGLIPGSVPPALPKPPSGTWKQLGAALLALDMVECQERPLSSGTFKRCGQELLVGAPDRFTGSTPGRAFIYEADPTTNTGYAYQGEVLYPPFATASLGDEFGASFAAGRRARTVISPWTIAPDHAPWVAVGAPGRNSVFVYFDLDHTKPDPLSDAVVAVPPRVVELPGLQPNSGYALQAGDFDGDSIMDLAVGAPGAVPYDFTSASVSGLIVMYWGTTDTSEPLYPFEDPAAYPRQQTVIDPTVAAAASAPPNPWYEPDMSLLARPCPGGSPPPLSCANGGGTALAAGRLMATDNRDVLIAGYPSWSRGQGYVCQFVFTASRTRDPMTVCFADPTNTLVLANEFGYSVEVGDFNPVDSFGSKVSLESRFLEVAVSSPAAEGFSGTPGAGRVDIYPVGLDGLIPVVPFTSSIADNEGEVASGRFGESMDAGYVHLSPFEDLLVGAPSRSGNEGNASLTIAANPNECTVASPEGEWTGVDADSVPQTVLTFNDPEEPYYVILFPSGYQMRLVDSTGSPCTSSKDASFTGVIDLPPDSRLVLDSPWACSGSPTQSWVGQNSYAIINQVLQSIGIENKTLDAEVDVTVTHTSPTTATATISFSKLPTGALGVDSTCDIADPLNLSFVRPVCETP